MPFYTDIHSHIMPGVDDGSKDMEESIAMLLLSQREHIGKIILTPHQKPDRHSVTPVGIMKRMERLQEELDRRRIEIKLYPGSELLYSHELNAQLESGDVCTLAGSHYILVEFLPGEGWTYIRNGLYGLSCAGYWPVIAHVERYQHVIADYGRVQELIDMGCYIQVNAGSLTGDCGFMMRKTCLKLLKNHQLHFIGTDAHRSGGKRSPQMENCAGLLYRKAGKYADELLWMNAEKIFADEEI